MALKIDLHLHTTESDGMLTPPKLVRSVALAGLDYFAVTDHDTMTAYSRAPEAFEPHATRLIRGIELSTSAGGKEVHILGYRVRPECAALARLLADRAEVRSRRAEQIVDKLAGAGIALRMADVQRQCQGSIIGRPHIARALIERGFVRNNEEAFARYLGAGCIAYVPSSEVTPAQAIQAIRECGGIAVLAHPARSGVDHLLSQLIASGLQGIEAFSPSHTPHDVERYRALAKALGLVTTGGTDFHQPTESYPRPGVEIEASDLAPFLSLLR